MTPADADFDLEREPMTRGGLFLLGVAWITSWLAVWVTYRAFVAAIGIWALRISMLKRP